MYCDLHSDGQWKRVWWTTVCAQVPPWDKVWRGVKRLLPKLEFKASTFWSRVQCLINTWWCNFLFFCTALIWFCVFWFVLFVCFLFQSLLFVIWLVYSYLLTRTLWTTWGLTVWIKWKSSWQWKTSLVSAMESMVVAVPSDFFFPVVMTPIHQQ